MLRNYDTKKMSLYITIGFDSISGTYSVLTVALKERQLPEATPGLKEQPVIRIII